MMPRVKPKSKMSGKGRSTLKTVDRKPIRPLERQRMRPWLIDLLDRKSCHQLEWFNKANNTFKVSWKHAAGQTFDPDSDATLFELWARHTGKYYTGDRPDPKKWKANFRCALHSLPDVDEDKTLGVRRGNNAFRVYKFLDEKRVKRVIKGKDKDEKSSDDETDDEEFRAVRNLGTKSRPKKMDTDALDSEGSEAYSPSHESNHSDWDISTDDLQQPDHESESEKSPLPNFEELCQSYPKEFRLPETIHRVPEIITFDSMETTDEQEIMYQRDTEESVQLQFEYDPESREFFGIWSSIIDTNLDVQEEVVSSVDGPNVIVLEERPSTYEYTHEFTSMAEL